MEGAPREQGSQHGSSPKQSVDNPKWASLNSFKGYIGHYIGFKAWGLGVRV